MAISPDPVRVACEWRYRGAEGGQTSHGHDVALAKLALARSLATARSARLSTATTLVLSGCWICRAVANGADGLSEPEIGEHRR